MRLIAGGYFAATESGATYYVTLTAVHCGEASFGRFTVSKGTKVIERGEHGVTHLQCQKHVDDATKHICGMVLRKHNERMKVGFQL